MVSWISMLLASGKIYQILFNYVFKYITVNTNNLSCQLYFNEVVKNIHCNWWACTGKSMSSIQGKPGLNPERFAQETETDSQADGREAGSSTESELLLEGEGAWLLMSYTSSREASHKCDLDKSGSCRWGVKGARAGGEEYLMSTCSRWSVGAGPAESWWCGRSWRLGEAPLAFLICLTLPCLLSHGGENLLCKPDDSMEGGDWDSRQQRLESRGRLDLCQSRTWLWGSGRR